MQKVDSNTTPPATPVFSMKRVAPTAAAILGLPPPAAATEPPIAAIAGDLANSRRLAILAPDALGILPWRLWKDRMPFLSALHAANSILLEALMPSNTPTNFAAMLTGTGLAVHGMDKPYQRDGQWVNFQCETIYDVVRHAGGQSAGAGLTGATGDKMLARCADLGWVSPAGTATALSELIMEQYEKTKPAFLIAQFADVDSIFHKHGPSNPEVVPTLEAFDRALSKLVKCLTRNGAAVIVLADHGQHDIPDAPPEAAKHGRHGTDSPEDRLVPCTWTKSA